MKVVYPNYDRNLVNFSASILKEFGVESDYPTLVRVDKILREDDYKNIIVLLYDGLGTKIMEKHLDEDSFLLKNKLCYITSTMPSTTMAATATILSAKTPYEHGHMGWNMYFKDLDETVTIASGKIKNSDVLAGPDDSVLHRCLAYENIIDKINNSGSKAYGIFSFGLGAYENREEAYERIINLSKNSGKKLIYAYFEEPDHLMHELGVGHKDVHQEILKIDDEVKWLCNELQDSVIFVLADHGHINSEAIVIKNYDDIFNLLDRTFDIEPRCTGIKVKEGKQEEFRKLFNEKFGEYFLLMDYDEVVSKKLFGLGVEHECFKDALGDFLAIATDRYYLNYDENDPVFKSNHAGLTENEMAITISAIKKKPFKDGVRRAVVEDYKIIRDMCNNIQKFRISNRKDIFGVSNTISPTEFDKYCRKNSPDVCFVYTIQDEIVGFAKLSYNMLSGNKLYDYFSYIEIENLFVKEEYRNRGVGTALVNSILEYGRKKRVNKMEFCAWNFEEETLRFIEKFGAKELFRVLEFDVK